MGGSVFRPPCPPASSSTSVWSRANRCSAHPSGRKATTRRRSVQQCIGQHTITGTASWTTPRRQSRARQQTVTPHRHSTPPQHTATAHCHGKRGMAHLQTQHVDLLQHDARDRERTEVRVEVGQVAVRERKLTQCMRSDSKPPIGHTIGLQTTNWHPISTGELARGHHAARVGGG